MVAELISIVLPVYLCAGFGYAWIRMGRRYDTELITDLIMNVGAPCLVFSSIVDLEMEGGLVFEMAAAILVAIVVMLLIAAVFLRLAGLSIATFIGPMTMPNTGNMGLPVLLFAFGAEGFALGVVIFAIMAMLQFTVMIWFWERKVSFARIFRTPLSYAVVIAAALVGLDLEPPEWTIRFTSLLGAFTVPLMQFTLGVSLAQLKVDRIPPNGDALGVSHRSRPGRRLGRRGGIWLRRGGPRGLDSRLRDACGRHQLPLCRAIWSLGQRGREHGGSFNALFLRDPAVDLGRLALTAARKTLYFPA